MFSSVTSVIRFAVGAVVAAIIGIFAVSEWAALQAERNAVAVGVSAERLAGPQFDLALTLKNLQINVIQVQQWLTDISATRGRDGLDDGFVAAQEQAEDFARNAAEARRLAGALGLDPLATALAEVEAAFPAYYAAGSAMAERYIEGGAEAGNTMMGGFDAAAATLHGELDQALALNAAALEQGRAAMREGLGVAKDAAVAANRLEILLGALALGAMAAFAWILFRWVEGPLRAATAAAERLAAGDAETAIETGARLRELRALSDGLNTFRAGAGIQLAAASAVENSLTPTVVVRADGRPVIVNRAFGALWTKLAPGVRADWSAGSGDVKTLDFSRLVAAVRGAQARGETRVKAGGRRAAELRGGGLILEARIAPLVGRGGAEEGAVVEIEDVTGIRRLEEDFLAAIDSVKAGHFDSRVKAMDDLGFTSTAARGFNTLCEAVARFIAELSRALDAMAEGDLTTRMPSDFQGRFGEAGDGFNRSVAKLRDTVQEVASASKEVSEVAGPIAGGARDLASRAETEAAALDRLTATAAEFGAALKGAAGRSGEAVALSRTATEGAAAGAATVAETVQAVTRIEESSNNIRDIVNVIDGIAFQTNLLALNAAVEAARAGEAGKGFAVVASEVRQLAQRSADAAEEVRKLIAESSTHVADGVRLVHRTGETLGELERAVRSVAETVGAISRSMTEQFESVEQMAGAMRGLDGATQRNAALAEQSASSAQRLILRAERLGGLVEAFRLSETQAAVGRGRAVAAE